MADKKSELAKVEQERASSMAFVPNEENIKLLKDTIAGQKVDLTDAEFQLVIYTATQRGLNPLTRQMYVMKDRSGRLSLITSIDGQRLIADRTGKYRGQTEPQWCGSDGKWVDVWLQSGPPAAARVGVYKEGFETPVYAVATYVGYCQKNYEGKPTGQWGKMPDVMLSKCAESLALRKAFPEDLSGLYTQEEMGPAEVDRGDVINHDTGEIISADPDNITKQIRKIFAMLRERGIKDGETAKAIVYELADVDSMTKLTKQSASEVIEKVENMTPEDIETFFLPEGAEVVQEPEVVETTPAKKVAAKAAPKRDPIPEPEPDPEDVPFDDVEDLS